MPGPSVAELWPNLLSFPLGSPWLVVVGTLCGLSLAVHLYMCGLQEGQNKMQWKFFPILIKNLVKYT